MLTICHQMISNKKALYNYIISTYVTKILGLITGWIFKTSSKLGYYAQWLFGKEKLVFKRTA